jgi:beta-lactam-binding protein with PASTA domain
MNGYLAGQPVLPLPATDPRYTQGGHPSQVPEVVGQADQDAEPALHKDGWQTSEQQVDNRAPQGTVVRQSPHGTAMPGQVVTLQISTGEVPPPPPAPGESPPGSEDPAQPAPGGAASPGMGGPGDGLAPGRSMN